MEKESTTTDDGKNDSSNVQKGKITLTSDH